MTSSEQLPLENALEETPQVASLVGVYSSDAQELEKFIDGLHNISSQLVSLYNKLTTTYQDLSKHLKHCSPVISARGTSEDIKDDLKEFGDIALEMSSWHHSAATQIANGVVYPLSNFLDSDLVLMKNLASSYQNTSKEVERAIERYSRIKKSDSIPEKTEVGEELYKNRKSHHQNTLLYYSRLNNLQKRQPLLFLQPLLSLVTACRFQHQHGIEFLTAKTSDRFMSNVGITLKRLNESYLQEFSETEKTISSILDQSELMYYPEPPGELANLPPDTTLHTKSGYLNVHRKYMGLMSTWERQFVFVEGGNILSIPKGEVAGSLVLELEPSTLAHAAETDGRAHVFTVVSAMKSVTFQAINDRERDEWMFAIEKCAQEGGYIRDRKKESAAFMSSSSLLQDVGHFFKNKMQSASNALGTSSVSKEVTRIDKPSSSSSEKIGSIIPSDVPIIFDISANHDEDTADCFTEEMSSDAENFDVRFVGCMKVKVDTVESFMLGQAVVFEVIERILEARQTHQMFVSSKFNLRISPLSLAVLDTKENSVVLNHRLKDVAFWAPYSDNPNLMGYIVRRIVSTSKVVSFSCYVYEMSSCSAKTVCVALGRAARKAYDMMLDKATVQQKRKGESKLLLANIAQLPDASNEPQINEGFLILDDQQVNPIYTHSTADLILQESSAATGEPESEA